MIEFMNSYKRFYSRVFDTLSNEIIMKKLEEPSKYIEWRGALSFSYERETNVDSHFHIVL